jgi:hypothetical protein
MKKSIGVLLATLMSMSAFATSPEPLPQETKATHRATKTKAASTHAKKHHVSKKAKKVAPVTLDGKK